MCKEATACTHYHKTSQDHPKVWIRWHLWLSSAGAHTHRGTLGTSPATGLRPTDYPANCPGILCSPGPLAHSIQRCLSWSSFATISPRAGFGFLIPPAASLQTSWSLHCPAHLDSPSGCCKTWLPELSLCSLASLTHVCQWLHRTLHTHAFLQVCCFLQLLICHTKGFCSSWSLTLISGSWASMDTTQRGPHPGK